MDPLLELLRLLLLTMAAVFAALTALIVLTFRLHRQGRQHMAKTDDLTAAVADLQVALGDQMTAIDTEVKQLADAIANSGLPADQQAALQASIDNIAAAAANVRTSTANLAADDAPSM